MKLYLLWDILDNIVLMVLGIIILIIIVIGIRKGVIAALIITKKLEMII
jgi:hypothetical protein